MTHPSADDARVKPVRGPWRSGGSWLGSRAVAAAAALCIAALFVGLALTLRERSFPRKRADFPPPARLDARIAAAQDKLKANSQDIAALVDLGTSLFAKGKGSYVEAISDLEEARDLGALDERLFYCLGVMYQEEGLYPFALTEYQRFLRHHPDDKEVRLLAAKLEYAMGRYADAVNEYERLKFTNGGDPLIEENLGLSLWGVKLTDRAAGSFGQLKTYGGDFGRRAEFYLGEMALQAGKFQEAADHFAQSGLTPSRPLPGIPDERAFAALGTAQQKLGRWDEAKAAWEAALKAAPKDAKAQAALREVNRRLSGAKRSKKK